MLPLSYQHVNNQKDMADAPRETTVSLQIVKLVAELSRDAKSILQESNNNQEARNGGNVGLDGLANLVNDILNLSRIFLHGLHCVCS